MIRVWLLFVALLAPTAPAIAQEIDSRAHMEGCLKWQSVAQGYAAFNQCDSRIAIKFMMLEDRRVIEGEAAARGQFVATTSLRGEMMFTACPVGYEPSIRFSIDNAKAIIVSLYNCLPARRPNS